MTRLLARLPFTLLLEVALTLGLFDPDVAARWRERQGFGWPSLVAGRPLTLVTSTFLVEGFRQWLRIALLITWSVGALEWRAGSARTMRVYAVTTIVSALATALAQAVAGLVAGPELAFARSIDVGASAGAFGCLGAALGTLAPPWRARVALCVLAYVLVKPLVAPAPTSDLAHGLALALGYVLARRWKRAPAARA